jgi:hypothetical protein
MMNRGEVDTHAFHLVAQENARTSVDVEMSSNKQLFSLHLFDLRTQDIRWRHTDPRTMEQEGKAGGKGEEKRKGRS